VLGEPTLLRVRALNDIGEADSLWSGSLSYEADDPSTRTPANFVPQGGGSFLLKPVTFYNPGIHRIAIRSADGGEAIAGPILVVSDEEALRPRPGEDPLRIFWGDIHGHSNLGDGIHPPEKYFSYARDVASLDFTCLSEHDARDPLQVGLDHVEGSWKTLSDVAQSARRPGFAVLLGWEWSSKEWGHRIVLFPSNGDRYVSSREASTPAELAAAVRSSGAFSILAHPRGSELTPPLRWDAVVPGFDRAVEVYSGRGSMEDDGRYRQVSNPTPSTSAMESLARDIPLAFVASSDTHLSTPGNPFSPGIRDIPYPGGLTGVWAQTSTEAAIFEAIRAGRTYATTGEKFLINVQVGDRIPGETFAPPEKTVHVQGIVAAVRGLERLEIMDRLKVTKSIPVRGKAEASFSVDLESLNGDSSIWLRGESIDGERFWTTPVRVRGI